ncbi:MAG: phosphate ABC transporter permease [Pirellulaceae bacterium]|nr:MAG: phosphate ABC transporter permease [Pirellulaceae bacterium]
MSGERMRLSARREKPLATRRRLDRTFEWFCASVSLVALALLAVLLAAITWQGAGMLSLQFLRSSPTADVERAGIFPALVGTVWVCFLAACVGLPLGIASAVFLEEYRPRGRMARFLWSIIQTNVHNLAGVPSVVYGILGLTLFVQMFQIAGRGTSPAWEIGVQYYDQFVTEGDRVVWVAVAARNAPPARLVDGMAAVTPRGQSVRLHVVGPNDPLPADPAERAYTLRSDAEGGRISRERWYYFRVPFGRGVLSGALTLTLVILPVVVIASQEALRAVPPSLREGAFALGATRWQVVRQVTLPVALPGILTGAILAMSRAIGEAAPILIIAGIVYISQAPQHLMDDFSVLPLQIYNWAQRPQAEFHRLAAAGILVLLAILLAFNAVAVLVRHRAQRSLP